MEIIYKGKKYTSTVGKTLAEVIDFAKVQEARLCIFINGEFPRNLSLERWIRPHDTVFIYPELSGRTGLKIGANVALLAATVASAGAFGPVSGIARAGILVAGAAVATGLQALAARSIAQINGQENVESPTYSLTASGNSFRPYEPMPIIFGKHNIYPDFSAQPYNEFKTYQLITYDSNTWRLDSSFTELGANMTTAFTVVAPVTGETFNLLGVGALPAPVLTDDYWYRYVGGFGYRNTETDAQEDPPPSLGDQYRRTYVKVDTCPAIPSLNNRWVSWEDFSENGSNANFSAVLVNFTNSQNYLYDEISQPYTLKSEVVKQIMNYGFGDLIYDSNQIGTTTATDFREYQETLATQTPTNWTLPQGEPNFTTVGNPVQYFTNVNGNVDTVDGGRLDNQQGFAYPNNWVIRQGPENVFALQLDIEGRQFALDKVNGGTAILTRYFDFQYRQVAPVVTAWTNFPDSMTLGNGYTSPYALVHGSSGIIYRDTVFIDNLSLGQYEVRARRRDANETSQDLVSEIYMKRVRFYQDDEQQNYVAQNRKAIIVESDSQLNGTLSKLSSVVSAKCWKNDGNGNFTWDETSNPADWFLYYARGAFKNTSADGTLNYPYSPTVGWLNSADHPDNGEWIFGAGIEDSRIDFDSITDWWNYCNDNNIQFAAVLDKTENVYKTFEKICAVGRATPTFALGKLGVVFENPVQLPVAMFTPENILKDSFELAYITEDLPDEVIVNFMDENKNWSQNSVRAVAIGVTLPINTQTFDFWGITLEDQAQREANRLVARQTYQRRLCKFSVDGEGLIVTRGDVVKVSYELFNWDYSSRIISLTHDGVRILQIEIDCEIDDEVSHISIRNPNGDLNQYAASINQNIITLIDTWQLVDAPYYLDQQQTVNAVSQFLESVPEDFLIIAGNRPSPGRLMRIVGITPKSENNFEIECTEEDPGFYAQEYTITGLPLPIQYERLKAKVENAGYILKGNGKFQLYWKTDGSEGVRILLSVNSGPTFIYTVGGATHFGNDVEITYSSGDTIVAIIEPIYIDLPFSVQSQTLTFTLD